MRKTTPFSFVGLCYPPIWKIGICPKKGSETNWLEMSISRGTLLQHWKLCLSNLSNILHEKLQSSVWTLVSQDLQQNGYWNIGKLPHIAMYFTMAIYNKMATETLENYHTLQCISLWQFFFNCQSENFQLV